MLSRKMLRVAGALVFGSLMSSTSPILYFAHMASLSVRGIDMWRKTTTAPMSLSVTLVASLVLLMKFSGKAAPNPPFGLVQSKTWRYLPLIFAIHSSPIGGSTRVSTSARAVLNRPMSSAAAPAATPPTKPRRGVLGDICDMATSEAGGRRRTSDVRDDT